MVHSDDQGLVLPPALAPQQVVFIPVGPWQKNPAIIEKIDELFAGLKEKGIRAVVDDSDKRPGNKYNEWELRGAPLRVDLGPRDLENNKVVIKARDSDEKVDVSFDDFENYVVEELEAMQGRLLERARNMYAENTYYDINTMEELEAHIETCKEENKPTGFVLVGWDGTEESEAKIQELTGFTTRNLPFEGTVTPKETCIVTGKPAKETVWIARAY